MNAHTPLLGDNAIPVFPVVAAAKARPARSPRNRLASWGPWSAAHIRMLKIGDRYWIRVRNAGNYEAATLVEAYSLAIALGAA